VRRDDDNAIPGKVDPITSQGRQIQDLGSIAFNPRWKQMQLATDTQPWTDDYSNVLSWFDRLERVRSRVTGKLSPAQCGRTNFPFHDNRLDLLTWSIRNGFVEIPVEEPSIR
jgi:hypothetical protein